MKPKDGLQKILVPLDGSPLAERALEPAMTIARKASGELLLLSVPVLNEVMESELAWQEASQKTADYLNAVQQKKVRFQVKLTTQVGEGDVAGAIVDIAAAEKVNLIALSSHGYSGVRLWMLGSVAERVLQHAPCPVLVVHSERPIERILITLDGSELAELALKPALELAEQLDVEASVLHVCHLSGQDVAPLPGEPMPPFTTPDAYLEELRGRYPMIGRDVPVEVIYGWRVPHLILDYAVTHGVDLIAMCTHGRAGLGRWIYGSTTAKVLHGFDGSMLIVRAPAAPAGAPISQ
jgi:nucleotide-binding universal stress UspA family protein